MWEEGRLAPGRLRDGDACNKSDRQRQGRGAPRRRLAERSVRSRGESRISLFLDELAPTAIFLHDLTCGAWRAVCRPTVPSFVSHDRGAVHARGLDLRLIRSRTIRTGRIRQAPFWTAGRAILTKRS